MAHEDLSREMPVEGSSDRAFGFVFSALFLVAGAWPLLHRDTAHWWAIVVSGGFAAIAWLRPEWLSGLNRLWLRLGLVLGKVVSPIALAILFYGLVVPTGLVMRLAGKDVLRLKRDSGTDSYWIRREPPGPPPGSMGNQF